RIAPDVLAVTDTGGTVLAVAGRRSADWPPNVHVQSREDGAGEKDVSAASGVFQFASAPLALQDTTIGSLQLAKALDDRYARELSTLSGASTLIAAGDRIIATTLPADLQRTLAPAALRSLPSRTVVELGGT